MLEKEMSTGCELLTHKTNTEPHMFFYLLEFNLEFLVPLGAIDRFIPILEITELCTWGGTYDQVRGPRSDQLSRTSLFVPFAEVPPSLKIEALAWF